MAHWLLIGLLTIVIGLIGYLALMIDSGVSDKRKGIIVCSLFVLCAGMVGVFLLVEDKTEFVYSGAPDLPAKNKKKKAAKGKDDGGMPQVEEAAASGGGGVALADATPASEAAKEDAAAIPPFQDCDSCPPMVMVKVEADAADLLARPGVAAEKGPTLPARYAIGRTEITIAQFEAFLKETGHRPSDVCAVGGDPKRAASYLTPGFAQTPEHPVVCVTWHDAAAYTGWLRRRTGKPYRLPTEAEWEYAARAGSPGLYATGLDITAAQATFDPRKGERPQGTTAVASWRPNGLGLYDVHGNVFELTSDCWNGPQEVASADKRAKPIDPCARRVMKGGAWYSSAPQLTFAARYGHPIDAATNGIGFRVARD